MAWTTPTSKATDDVVTAATFNAYTVDNPLFLYSPPCCSVTRSAAKSLTNDTLTTIDFDAENYDTDSMHSTVTNNSRVTITTAGKYLISATFDWTAGLNGRRFLAVYRNGVQIRSLNAAPVPANGTPAGSGECGQSIVLARSLAAADYIEIKGYQSSGGALSVFPEMEVTWVSG